jgi:hypothetical protein
VFAMHYSLCLKNILYLCKPKYLKVFLKAFIAL